jgi:hypothetical protein
VVAKAALSHSLALTEAVAGTVDAVGTDIIAVAVGVDQVVSSGAMVVVGAVVVVPISAFGVVV